MLLKSEISAAKKKMKNIYNRKRQDEKERKKKQEANRENIFLWKDVIKPNEKQNA